MNPVNHQASIEPRYRTLLILWFALFASIGMFFLLTLLTKPNPSLPENNTLILVLFGISAGVVIAAYILKQKFLAQSVAKQDVGLVQQGLILAAALNEVAAMLGLLCYFMTANRYYYAFFILAAIGSLLNFPKRDHLLAASYKKNFN